MVSAGGPRASADPTVGASRPPSAAAPAPSAHKRLLGGLAHGRRAVLVPGAPDALGARLLEQLGFQALYLSGAGLANAQFGVPDVGLVTATEVADQIERIRGAVDLPLIVDGDTGFGGPLNVRRTVQTFERRGASAVQLEDQTFPKKCGHFEGKTVVDTQEMVARIHAATDAREDDDFLVIARTDARATHGLDHALERAQAYRDAGADVLFVEAPETRAEIEAIAAQLAGPKVINIVEGGKTPQLELAELDRLGYTFVLYANAAMRGALFGMRQVMRELLHNGSTQRVADQMLSWADRQSLAGKREFDALESRYELDAARAPTPSPRHHDLSRDQP